MLLGIFFSFSISSHKYTRFNSCFSNPHWDGNCRFDSNLLLIGRTIDSIMVEVVCIVVEIDRRLDSTSSPEHCSIDRAVTSDLFLLMLNVLLGSLGAGNRFVTEHQELWILTVHAINVFERTTGGFRVEEINDGHEYAVEDRPDDVKLPPKALNARRGNFHDFSLLETMTLEVVNSPYP